MYPRATCAVLLMKILAGKHATWGDPLASRDWLKYCELCRAGFMRNIFLLRNIECAMENDIACRHYSDYAVNC